MQILTSKLWRNSAPYRGQKLHVLYSGVPLSAILTGSTFWKIRTYVGGALYLGIGASIQYSETSNEVHFERGQTSQQRTNQKYSTLYTIYLKEDNFSTKDKVLGPKCVHYLEVTLSTMFVSTLCDSFFCSLTRTHTHTLIGTSIFLVPGVSFHR